MKNNTFRLSVVLIFFLGLWGISALLHQTAIWFIVINLMAIYLLIKRKAFDKADVLTGVSLGMMCMPSSLIMGISTILPYIAAMTIFKNSANGISFYKNGKSKTLIRTLGLIFVVGGILGGINVLLALGSTTIHLSLKLQWLADALRAGIFEEISFRFFFFAICLYAAKDQPLSRLQNILCYAVMVIPHVLLHFDLQTFNVVNFILLSLLFGLPFAWMQRKYNLVSAMGAHAFVDLIRFCVLSI